MLSPSTITMSSNDPSGNSEKNTHMQGLYMLITMVQPCLLSCSSPSPLVLPPPFQKNFDYKLIFILILYIKYKYFIYLYYNTYISIKFLTCYCVDIYICRVQKCFNGPLRRGRTLQFQYFSDVCRTRLDDLQRSILAYAS